ncbi:unnamed protein product [Lactuca saligna]|uniref:Uncharacterized protein n=1 Tax=Lactuca saligna TaxID=75948 RepID=A0AA36DW21_LACSI|nr:unnamed protein product [Lactuca saligna]
MAGDILVTSWAEVKSPLRPIQSLDGGKTSIQEEHASNRTPTSQTPSSSMVETPTTYIANLWCPTTSTTQQIAILTTTSQIIAMQKTYILASQQQSFPHVSGTETWILHTVQSQPQNPSIVHPHAAMAGLSHVPIFSQQPLILNQLT